MRTSRTTRATLAALAVAVAALTAPGLASASDPKADTGSPQDITTTSATMRATIVLSVLGGSVTWDYGTTTAYGMTTPAVQTSLVGVGENVTAPVTGLLPNTTYHVRVTATALLSVYQGKDVTFRTKKADDGGGSSSGSSGSGSGSSGSGSSSGGSTAPATTTSPSVTVAPSSSGSSSSGSGKPGGSDDTAAAVLADDDGTDGGATSTPGVATADVTPVLGQTLAVAAVAGTVTATAPTGATVSLSNAQTIPTGTLIDARRGTVELKTALAGGATQTARFWGAQFEVRQDATRKGLTQLVLRGANFGACPAAGAAKARARAASKATKKKPPARSLWGSDDHGRFETRGRGSVATVRGTRWLTTDTCAGTRTTVLKGAVAVKDVARNKTVLVTKGHSYLARVAP